MTTNKTTIIKLFTYKVIVPPLIRAIPPQINAIPKITAHIGSIAIFNPKKESPIIDKTNAIPATNRTIPPNLISNSPRLIKLFHPDSKSF